MLYAFIDESYTSDRYYVSAFVVDERQLESVGAALANAREYALGFGVVGDVEFHGYEIMSGRNAWTPIRGRPRAALAIFRNALAELAAVPGARLFIQGVDVTRLNARYRYPEPPHRITLRHLLEDVDRFAVSRNERVIVIADELPDQADHARRVDAYRQTTTGGTRPRKLEAIDGRIRFGPSLESPGLQAADLAVYVYRRMDAHEASDARARSAVLGLWTVLRPLSPVVRRWDP